MSYSTNSNTEPNNNKKSSLAFDINIVVGGQVNGAEINPCRKQYGCNGETKEALDGLASSEKEWSGEEEEKKKEEEKETPQVHEKEQGKPKNCKISSQLHGDDNEHGKVNEAEIEWGHRRRTPLKPLPASNKKKKKHEIPGQLRPLSRFPSRVNSIKWFAIGHRENERENEKERKRKREKRQANTKKKEPQSYLDASMDNTKTTV